MQSASARTSSCTSCAADVDAAGRRGHREAGARAVADPGGRVRARAARFGHAGDADGPVAARARAVAHAVVLTGRRRFLRAFVVGIGARRHRRGRGRWPGRSCRSRRRMQMPVQAVSQQTPSTQKPLAQPWRPCTRRRSRARRRSRRPSRRAAVHRSAASGDGRPCRRCRRFAAAPPPPAVPPVPRGAADRSPRATGGAADCRRYRRVPPAPRRARRARRAGCSSAPPAAGRSRCCRRCLPRFRSRPRFHATPPPPRCHPPCRLCRRCRAAALSTPARYHPYPPFRSADHRHRRTLPGEERGNGQDPRQTANESDSAMRIIVSLLK